MIYIVHGEDLSSSRKFITNLQDQNKIDSRIDLNISEATSTELSHKLNSIDIFGGKQMLVFDVSGMGRMNVDAFIDVIANTPQDFILIVLSSKELSSANAFIKNSSKLGARVMPFKKIADTNIFKFADYVFDGNRKMAYKELKKLTLNGEEPIYIFTMLLYNLRNIALAKYDSKLYGKLAPFVKSKVSKQSNLFTKKNIQTIYGTFYKLDIDAKTGGVNPELLVPLAVEKVLTYF